MFMLFCRLARLVLVTFALVVLGGCSSSSDGTGTSGTSGTSGTTAGGVAFRGTLTGKGESGVVDATLPSGTKTASVNPLGGEAAGATNTVVATVNLGGGKTFSLTGTYDEATKTLTITGGGYTLTGTLTGSTLSGTYTGPNGAGSFALQAALAGAVNVYCGTYKGTTSGSGSWNMVQGADNKLSGSYTETTGGSGLLSGTLAGSAITLSVSTGGVAVGTLSGDTINGTYGASAGDTKGTWTGAKGSCAQ
jgi:hypothetical protein